MMQRTYTEQEKLEILEFAKTHTIHEVKQKYSVSYCALRSWGDPAFKMKQLTHQKNDYQKNGMSESRKISRTIRNRQTYNNNKDSIRAKQKEYYQSNRDTCIARSKHYSKTHRIKLNEFTKNYRRDRYKKDTGFKIKANLRTRQYQALKGITKTKPGLELIGCEFEYFMGYLESLFKTGMTWENYGLWHVDHIKPCSAFDLTDPNQQKDCFHYTNQQPLWCNENLTKSNILPTVAIINCASYKKDYACMAKQMYDDAPMFRELRDYAEKNYDQYYILSAHYGLLHPTDIIEPYGDVVMFISTQNPEKRNNTVRLSAEEKREWADVVFNKLDWSKYSKINFIIGKEYWKPLEPLFRAANIPAERFELPQGIGNVINAFKNNNPREIG